MHIKKRDSIQKVFASNRGILVNTLDIPSLVFQLSVRMADRIKASTKLSRDTPWTVGEDFWRKYLHGASLESDTCYLHHMAIGGYRARPQRGLPRSDDRVDS